MNEIKNKYTIELYCRLWNVLPSTEDSFAKQEFYPNAMIAVIHSIAKLQHTGRHVHSRHTGVDYLDNTMLKRTLCIIKSRKVHDFSV